MNNSIRFLHIRPQDYEEQKPAIFGGKTVAFTLSDTDGGRLLRFAVAKCGKKQAFNRKIGREVASGMLNCQRPTSIAKHVREVVLEHNTHPYDALADLL